MGAAVEGVGEVGAEGRPDGRVVEGELDDGLEVLELVAGVEVAGVADLVGEEEVALVDEGLHGLLEREGLAGLEPVALRLELVEHGGGEDVAADARQVGGGGGLAGLLDDGVDLDEAVLELDAADEAVAVVVVVVGGPDAGEDAEAGALAYLDHLAEAAGGGLDEVVTEGVDERVVAEEAGGVEEGGCVARGPLLADVGEVGKVGDALDLVEELELAVLLEQLGQGLAGGVEVVLDGPLVVAGDDDDVLDAGVDQVLDDVLDHRLVDDREHLLRHRLGLGEEPRAVAGSGDHRLLHPRVGHGFVLLEVWSARRVGAHAVSLPRRRHRRVPGCYPAASPVTRAANSSTIRRACSSRYWTGGDFMK